MSANFTPSMGEYKDLSSFKFWCQKVLPTVYDDSLSYYELLNKVVNYLNDVINNSNMQATDVRKLYSAYVSLQDWVNHYFDNLDVQLEINNKLDIMSSDGSLSALVQPLFDAYKKNIDDTIAIQNKTISDNNTSNDQRITVLEGRMSTFTSLGEGSTTGDAELGDIRIDAYGKTHRTAGDAVRSQQTLDKPILNQTNVRDVLTKIQYYLKHAVYTGLRDNPNFERINNPQVGVDWVLTTGESGDVKSTVALDTTGKWEIKTRAYITGSYGGGLADIMVTTRDDNTPKSGAILEALDFTSDTCFLGLYVNLNGENRYTGVNVNRNQWLDIRAGYTGTKYYIEVTDETGTVKYKELGSSYLTPTGFFPTFGKKLGGYMQGKIDLSATEMLINGETVWRAIV